MYMPGACAGSRRRRLDRVRRPVQRHAGQLDLREARRAVRDRGRLAERAHERLGEERGRRRDRERGPGEQRERAPQVEAVLARAAPAPNELLTSVASPRLSPKPTLSAVTLLYILPIAAPS